MNVDLSKFLALTAMLSAPLVSACDLSSITGDGGGTGGATDGGGSDTSQPTGNGDMADDGSGAGSGGSGGATGGSSGDGSGGAADSSGDGSGGGMYDGACCDANGTPGCTDDAISNCVCNIDQACCTDEIGWDAACVDTANTMCDAACPVPACCTPVDTAGCPDDADIESCVCAIDPFCCGDMDGVWDSSCVDTASTMCDAGCPATE